MFFPKADTAHEEGDLPDRAMAISLFVFKKAPLESHWVN